LPGSTNGWDYPRHLMTHQVACRKRHSRYRGLSRTAVALQQPEHRIGHGEIGADGIHRPSLVGRELDRTPDLPVEAGDNRGPDHRIGAWLDLDRHAAAAAALPAAADHPDLEREELVEGEPLERRVAFLEGVRIVRRFDG